jgi:diguanylate cyclase (GGDEF)-like protein/PAS domain S-box-containing protein
MRGSPEGGLGRLGIASLDLLRSFLRFKDLKDFLRFVCGEVVKVLGVDLCGVFRYDTKRNRFVLIGGYGWRRGQVGRKTFGEGSHAHYCLRTRRPVRSEDLGSERRFSDPDLVSLYGITSLLAVPVKHLGGLWGVLAVYTRTRRSFSREEVEFLKAVAVAISEYLEKEHLARELRREKEIFQSIAENAPVLILIYRDRILYANPYAFEVFGYTREDLANKKVWELVHPDFRDTVREAVERRLRGDTTPAEYPTLPVITKEGGYRFLKLYATTVELRDGFAGLAVGVDITREINLERKLREEKAKLELILTHSHDIITIVDQEGYIRYKSPSSLKVLGWRPEEVVGRHFSEFVHPEDVRVLDKLKDIVFSYPGTLRTAEFRVRTKAGDYRWMEANVFLPENWKDLGLEGAVVSERDVTDRKRIEERIVRMTYYDLLTGLPNRILFIEKLKEVLNLALREGSMAGVVMLDLVKFSEINTVYGPEVGDELLRTVGGRIVSRLRSGDLVSRFFADKFGIALLGIRDLRGLSRALDKLRSVFQKPFRLKGHEISVSAYTGVAIFPKDGTDPEDLIRKAEIALSRAREMGPSSVVVFSRDAEEELREIAVLREGLKEALSKDQIRVYYQPVLRLRDRKVVGMEALVRWDHPELGLLPPSRFIQVAEDTGHIVDLGYCVLARAVRDLAVLQSLGFRDLFVAVNFSMRQFLEERLTENIRELLDTYRVDPDSFVVEITESTAMRDPERTKTILEAMREVGMKIAIDDFGTGYSSMNYLIEFEVDKIKIDRGFISAITRSERARAVVKAIVDLSHSVGALSLAEGIEEEEHLKVLLDLGCDEGQGYFFAPPMELKDLKEFIINSDGRGEGDKGDTEGV